MKKVRVILTAVACVLTVGAVLATTFVATKTYKVNSATGAPLMPLQQVGATSSCFESQLWCSITFEVDGQGNPVGQGTKNKGTYVE
jgi:hypothetical protein